MSGAFLMQSWKIPLTSSSNPQYVLSDTGRRNREITFKTSEVFACTCVYYVLFSVKLCVCVCVCV